MAAIRVSPGIYKDPRTGKTVRATTQAQADRMLGAGAGPQARGGGISQDIRKNVGNTIANNAPPGVSEVVSAGTDLSKTALGLANDQLKDWSAYETPDLEAERSRIQDEVYGRLTKNFDRDYTNEKAQLEQTLYNRGIPIDPNDPQYQRFMQGLDEKYTNAKENASARATELGGEELSRSTNISMAGHNINMNDIDQLGNTGYGTKGSELDLAIKDLEERKRANRAGEANTRAAIRKSGSGGAPAPTEDSAFIT